MIAKLNNFNFSKYIERITQSYLSNRTRQFNYQNSKSKRLLIRAGVPQGSIVGSILFLLLTDLSYLRAFKNRCFRMTHGSSSFGVLWPAKIVWILFLQKTEDFSYPNIQCWNNGTNVEFNYQYFYTTPYLQENGTNPQRRILNHFTLRRRRRCLAENAVCLHWQIKVDIPVTSLRSGMVRDAHKKFL